MTKEKTKALVVKDIGELSAEAKKVVIKNEKGMKEATEVLSRLNKRLDILVEEKEKVTKPLNAALKAERERFKPYEVQLQNSIDAIRKAMSIYQTEQTRLACEEEAKIEARVGEGKGKFTLETATRKMEEVNNPKKKISSASGSLRFREDKILKIIDEKLIPREYLVVDEKRVLNDLKQGKEIPGCEVKLVQIPINSR